MCTCVYLHDYAHTHSRAHTHVKAYMSGSEDSYGSLFSPSATWILGIKLWLSVLAASTVKLLDLLKAGKQLVQNNEHHFFLFFFFTLKYFKKS